MGTMTSCDDDDVIRWCLISHRSCLSLLFSTCHPCHHTIVIFVIVTPLSSCHRHTTVILSSCHLSSPHHTVILSSPHHTVILSFVITTPHCHLVILSSPHHTVILSFVITTPLSFSHHCHHHTIVIVTPLSSHLVIITPLSSSHHCQLVLSSSHHCHHHTIVISSCHHHTILPAPLPCRSAASR